MSLKVVLNNTLMASDLNIPKTNSLKGDFVSTDEKMLHTGVTKNELINTILLAYGHHRTLVLSPDDIMLVLSHAVCNCVNTYRNNNSTHSSYITHLNLTNLTNLTNLNWSRIIAEIESVENKVSSILIPEFSTTTRTSRISSRLATMSAFKRESRNEFTTLCGIPSVELRGTQDDWKLLKNKYENLKKLFNDFNQLNQYFLDMDVIINVLFLMRSLAPQGEIEAPDRIKQFWTKVVTQVSQVSCDSGRCQYLSGWSQCLFPTFSKESTNNSAGDVPERKNDQVPSSLCQCRIVLNNHSITFYSGFVGCQEREDGALHPVIGWFAREDGKSTTPPQYT